MNNNLSTHKRYGALCYSNSLNLGDNIQTIAARQFIPRVDYWIDRDNTGSCNSWIDDLPEEEIPIYTIYNGWFDGTYCNWPPISRIKPLLISVHINEEKKNEEYRVMEKFKTIDQKSLLDASYRSFYGQYGPVGCRDYETVKKCRSAGIDAYFSGCLTLTIQNPNPGVKRDGIYIVDSDALAPNLFRKIVPERIIRNASFLRHGISSYLDNTTKMKMAEDLIDKYSRAKLVITSRLHCVLPCIAMNTPVVFLHEDVRDCRFRGLTELMNCYTMESTHRIDWDNIQNPVDVEYITKSLSSTVKNFIGD